MKKAFFLLIFLAAISIELFSLTQWFTHCINFQGVFHADISQLNNKVVGDINSDKDLPVWQIRLFYNKYSEGVFFVLKPFLRFWDISFIANFLSFTGLLGLFFSLWYFFQGKKKKVWQWAIVIFVVLMPFLDIFFSGEVKFYIRFLMYALPLGLLSLFGVRKLLWSTRSGILVVCISLILSLWWILAGSIPFYIYCIQHATH